jgi:uncharacterized protein YigA (DUF484 family)
MIEGEAEPEGGALPAEWLAARALVLQQPDLLRDDDDLLRSIGLRHAPSNIVEFGPAALSRLKAARDRESSARQEVESLARANFTAQAQTHALIVELLEARNNADLAYRLNEAVQRRFGLEAAALAVEGTGAVPSGWRRLPVGLLDLILGSDGLCRMGPSLAGEELFGTGGAHVQSVALVRMNLWDPARQGVVAFGSGESDGFTPEMGVELVAFLARVVERIADRWPSI